MRNVFNWSRFRAPLSNYLCFTANTAWSTIKLTKTGSPTSVTLETSTDLNTWTTYTIWDTITLSNVWDSVYWRNTSENDTLFSTGTSNYYKFVMTWSISWSWDINYLLNKNSTTTVSSYCYYYMFNGCTSLVTAPSLPATTLANYCYSNMFRWCTWLTTAPVLPGTTLTNNCYRSMFYWCTSLVTAPSLPATTLADSCYQAMFNWCTSLTTPPTLSATTAAISCYFQMFYWCTNLEQLPALPATTLANSCYYGMFQKCSKIKISGTQVWEYINEYRIPTIWTWTGGINPMSSMFSNTWWTFTWTPSINTTYYTSNTIVS